VRTSNQGWEAGGSLPGRRECVYIDALMPLWARWGGEASGRGAAMPHIKTYCRYRGDRCPARGRRAEPCVGVQSVSALPAYSGSASTCLNA